MLTTLTRQQARQVDRLAIEALGIPGVVLMENAGRNAAEIILKQLNIPRARQGHDAQVAILCGGGNNGGDGYVIARHLHNHGVSVTIYTAIDPSGLTGDAVTHHAICRHMGLDIRRVTTPQELDRQAPSWIAAYGVVDALLGTGFSGSVRDHLGSVIERCNEAKDHGAKVTAIDVPSGLDCDTGQPSNATIRADLTVTFIAHKAGFTQTCAKPYVGKVIVADIGAPPQLLDQVLSE